MSFWLTQHKDIHRRSEFRTKKEEKPTSRNSPQFSSVKYLQIQVNSPLNIPKHNTRVEILLILTVCNKFLFNFTVFLIKKGTVEGQKRLFQNLNFEKNHLFLPSLYLSSNLVRTRWRAFFFFIGSFKTSLLRLALSKLISTVYRVGIKWL